MQFLHSDDLQPEHSSVMVMPAKRHDGRWDLFIILSQQSIERIKEYDPAELDMSSMPEELKDICPAPANIFVAYATYQEMKEILKDYEDGKGVHNTMRKLLRGRKERPEMGDGLGSKMAQRLKPCNPLVCNPKDYKDKDTKSNCARIDIGSIMNASAEVKLEAIKHMMIQAWVSGRKSAKRLDEMLNQGECKMDDELQKHLNMISKMLGFSCLLCGIKPGGIVDSDVKIEDISEEEEE